MAENGSKVVNDIQGGFGTVLAEGRLYVVVFATMVMTATVFVVWNGIQQDGPWLDRLLTGLEHMSWAIITSTGLTTTLILVWERLAMVLARRWLDRKREEVLQEGRQEGLPRRAARKAAKKVDERLRCSSKHGWSRWTGGSGQRYSRVAGPPKGSDGRRARVQRTYAVWQCQASRLASRDTLSHSLNDILASLANIVSQKPKLQHTWRYQCPM